MPRQNDSDGSYERVAASFRSDTIHMNCECSGFPFIRNSYERVAAGFRSYECVRVAKTCNRTHAPPVTLFRAAAARPGNPRNTAAERRFAGSTRRGARPAPPGSAGSAGTTTNSAGFRVEGAAPPGARHRGARCGLGIRLLSGRGEASQGPRGCSRRRASAAGRPSERGEFPLGMRIPRSGGGTRHGRPWNPGNDSGARADTHRDPILMRFPAAEERF